MNEVLGLHNSGVLAATLWTLAAAETPFPVGWWDLAVVVFLIVGFFQGRSRGISNEIVDVIQWTAIIVLGGLLIQPMGAVFAKWTGFALLYSYCIAYILFAMMLATFFSLFKKTVAQKLVEGNVFGRLEYFLGMAAGMYRWLCILVFLMSLVNAEYISEADLKKTIKKTEEEWGHVFFPPLGSIQKSIIKESITGRMVVENAPWLLIPCTAAPTNSEGISDQRKKDLKDAIGK